MKFYFNERGNKCTRLSGYNLSQRDFARNCFYFYKRKERKDFKGSFPDYTLPTFTTYRLFMIFITFKTHDKTCSKIEKAWFYYFNG